MRVTAPGRKAIRAYVAGSAGFRISADPAQAR
jgi:hypothetical protein